MSIFSPQSRTLPNVACVFAAIPFFLGINGLLKPRAFIATVDFPAPTTPEAEKLADALTRLFAARNVVVGSICCAIWYRGDRKLLGAAMIIESFSALVDGLVSLDLIGGGGWYHFPIIPVFIGIGAGLLGWFG
jgi:hypothetical protein